MKTLLLMLVATAAVAQGPSDFRARAPVIPTGTDALQRLTLPFEAYRDARPDFADLRVFNASGEAMPFAFAGEADPTRETPPATTLPMFPLYGAAPGREIDNRLDVRVQSNNDGTIVSIKGNTRVDRGQRPVAWLLDASQLKTPIRHLVFDWNSGPGTEVARVSVEASDDLKYWRAVASSAPLLRVEQGGQQLAQRKVDVGSLQAKYLRITASPAAFVVRAVEAEPAETTRPIARLTRSVTGTPGPKPGEYEYDLGARLPVEAIRVKLGAANSVAPLTLLARDNASAEPRRVTSATIYWLVREGVDLQSPPIEIGRYSARYWTLRLDPKSPAPGGGPPSIEVQWRPAQILFVARGDAPFSLAFGNPEVKANNLAPNQLIPGYERLAELKLPQAQVGAVTTGELRDDWIRKLTGDASPRKLALWAILLVAVIALGFMAWRLSRQI
jgi:hypothetical protein